MEKKTDGKMKSVASIPTNYVSILQLQERWMKEKERKQKETDLAERGLKQEVNGQRREEEEAMEPSVKLEGKSLGRGFRMDRREKEPNCVEKEEVKVSAIVIKKERMKKWSKKNQGGSLKEVIKCESKAYIPRGNNPVKGEIPGENIVQNRENVVSNSIAVRKNNSIAVETQFQHLEIKKKVEEDGRDAEVKGHARLNGSQGYYRNQKHDWSSTRATKTMVWVKKGENDEASGGENGV